MKPTRLLVPIVGFCAIAAAACGFERSSTTPTSASGVINTFVGTWSSAGATGIGVPALDSCTNVQWTATNTQSNFVAGNFSATCAGGLQATGSGSGTLVGSQLDWSASGNASQNGLACPFSLSGTAIPEPVPGKIRVNYSGRVCDLPVSGTEILTRN